jgi:hypothetical protein
MDGEIRTGDVIVCRVAGTLDLYVVGTVLSGKVGEFSLQVVSTILGQSAALETGYQERMLDRRVWLFDGAASGYVKTFAVTA